MKITRSRAEELSGGIEFTIDLLNGLTDNLAGLADEDVKGEERADALEECEGLVDEVVSDLRALIVILEKLQEASDG